MTSLYELQQDTLALFQGKKTQFLNETEINNLNIYKGLVINNMESLLSKIFKEIHSFLEPQWRDITLDYLQRHPSKSAIYNQLLKEFPDFVASDFFKEKYADNNYFAELAKYRWLDLKTYNSRNKKVLDNGFIQDFTLYETNFNVPLIIDYINAGNELDKNDDIEEEKSNIFIYRHDFNTKTLVINDLTRSFLDELNKNKVPEEIKNSFRENYQGKFANLDEQIDRLLEYLKNMKILLV